MLQGHDFGEVTARSMSSKKAVRLILSTSLTSLVWLGAKYFAKVSPIKI